MKEFKITPLFVVTALFIFSVYLIFSRSGNNAALNQSNELMKRQMSIMEQQVNDLQHVNSQMSLGNLDINGNLIKPLNVETIKYSAYCEGYNNAVRHMNSKDSPNGYVAGYHAAIEDIESSRIPPTEKKPKE